MWGVESRVDGGRDAEKPNKDGEVVPRRAAAGSGYPRGTPGKLRPLSRVRGGIACLPCSHTQSYGTAPTG